ncbi:hypothetical protein BG015_011674 [Linnemannia schmuckeri]|uniref:Extracellular membrane protein CFEM domain-containing protein n=1 Tax=Linnemannia schmuckeri TaxID=64567 RepID=A0A9P5VEE4_9FUNG|nr:hypothetical protein BG015_011674 [Linnemannia schmuckeri]
MKFTILAAAFVAFLASTASAQADPSTCTLCLQNALKQLPACTNVEVTAGSVSPAYAACLCSSLSGSWIDSCAAANKCGSAISAFKSSYASNIRAAGLTCGSNGQASFTPASA